MSQNEGPRSLGLGVQPSLGFLLVHQFQIDRVVRIELHSVLGHHSTERGEERTMIGRLLRALNALRGNGGLFRLRLWQLVCLASLVKLLLGATRRGSLNGRGLDDARPDVGDVLGVESAGAKERELTRLEIPAGDKLREVSGEEGRKRGGEPGGRPCEGPCASSR